MGVTRHFFALVTLATLAWVSGAGMYFRRLAPLIADQPVKKVLFIGVDGVGSDALSAANTPYLDTLIRRGAFANDTQILGERYRLNDTVSAAGWSSILTGMWADKHGVQGTTFTVTNFTRYPDFLRRLKHTRPTAKTAAFVSWEPIAHHILTSPDVVEVFPATRHSSAGYLEADRRVAESARHHLAADDADATFVLFLLPDAIGHAHGFHFRVPEYRRAIEAVDGLVGALLRAVWGRRTFSREDWLVVVTSDHGGRGTHHRNGHQDREILTVFLIVSGPAAQRGKIRSPTYIVDAAATVLKHLGVEVEGLDGRVVGLKTN
jgi:type I phosphodiesterase/nucleotide pyrophosphatase